MAPPARKARQGCRGLGEGAHCQLIDGDIARAPLQAKSPPAVGSALSEPSAAALATDSCTVTGAQTNPMLSEDAQHSLLVAPKRFLRAASTGTQAATHDVTGPVRATVGAQHKHSKTVLRCKAVRVPMTLGVQ